MNAAAAETVAQQRGSAFEVLRIFFRLGLTSFGGPVAHLGYYRAEFVERRRWLDESHFADIVALCQFLPGPASSQTAITIGILRAGLPGAFAAWLGFTAPSAVAMIAFGYGVAAFGDLAHAPWLHGLKIVAVAVVANAVWGMARNLCPDRPRATIAVGAAILALAVPSSAGQIGAIAAGGLIGWALLRNGPAPAEFAPLAIRLPRALSVAAGGAFVALLIGLPVLAAAAHSPALALFAAFYRSGALVFGGGHVVLPLLQAAVVPPGWVGNDAFLAGYGAAQAVPGPLFTFAAYLGTVMGQAPNGWLGGLLCLAAIFLPSFLLLIAALPFWDGLRHRQAVRSALRGINAAVVGVLLAALYHPVWTSAILAPADFAIAIAGFLLLALWAAPPWLVVMLGALAATMVAWLPGSG
ncbi:MAG TPA: chromate efflux transporter [Stellaceae bacterium]|jgi:chromate transporter|nr:chromate efflux transporter [Stellaceae bacterium]